MKKILIVEDDRTLLMGIEYSLKAEGYDVDMASSVEKSKKLIDENEYDLVLLDVGLPDGNGFEVCKHIRESSNLAVIFLTAEDDEVNVVMGLDMGADDYITKPFRIRELMSRIKAIFRRTASKEKKELLYSKDLILNISENKLYKKGELINLTPSEYRLLLHFMRNPKIGLSRLQILENLWDIDGDFIDDNSLSVYIKRIREKIEDDIKNPKYIKTIRGLGYTWDYPVRGE